MAIIPDCPGLEAQVTINGHALSEYDDRSEVPRKTVKRFIEATTGANFKIQYSFTRPFPFNRPVSMKVIIDGNLVDEPLLRPFELIRKEPHVSEGPISNVGSRCFVQKFCFSDLETVEDDSETIPDEMMKKFEPVGTITLQFFFLENAQRNRHLHVMHKELEEFEEVSEKIVKGQALSHQVRLGELEATESVEYFDADYAGDGKPFATFHFHYHSLEALKALHIIPRTPEPLDINDCSPDAIKVMGRDQLRAMLFRFQRQHNTRRRLKREHSGSATVAGDDDDNSGESDDIVEVSASDLRAVRKLRRMASRQLPSENDVVIVLD